MSTMDRASRKSRKNLLAEETGTIYKRWQGRIKIAIAYPNRYHVGMSNLGFQSVYRLLNSFDEVVCERVFLPEHTENTHASIRSLESSRPVADFDILAFSLSFENDYPNLLTILNLAGLPLRSKDRSPPLPLVIAGGVCCLLNPEPIAEFIDCFLIGEAEPLLPEFIEHFDPHQDRRATLLKIARHVPGTYVPAFYEATYHRDGALADFKPTEDVPERINRRIQADLSTGATGSAVLTPNTTFQKSYLVEVTRGCPHGCRFCVAGYIYRPPRYRPLTQLKRCIKDGSALTSTIGLVGAAVSDHPDIEKLCQVREKGHLRFSFSSLRADGLSPKLLSALKESGLKTAAIAPDAGSEKLQKVINKGISETDILDAVESLVAHGIANLKLYFMVGLPTETMEDVISIVALVKRLKHRFLQSSRTRRRIGEITISLNCFVPKPFTPFQWVAMQEIEMLKTKIKSVRQGVKTMANIRLHSDLPRWAYIQALFSRGDRRVAQLLEAAHQNRGNWVKTLKTSALNSDFYVYRKRDIGELLPWDFIDHGIEKSYLVKEYEKALRAETTSICRPGVCSSCGVCEKDTPE